MNSPLYTPKRALLECRWQIPKDFQDHPVVELGSSEYATVNGDDILTKPHEEELQPKWLGQREAFPHRHIKEPTPITYSGYIACHVMWPFDPLYSRANVLVGVWEEQEDFRVVQVDPERLLVARALVDYISPTRQHNEFIHLVANLPETPRSDTFM